MGGRGGSVTGRGMENSVVARKRLRSGSETSQDPNAEQIKRSIPHARSATTTKKNPYRMTGIRRWEKKQNKNHPKGKSQESTK